MIYLNVPYESHLVLLYEFVGFITNFWFSQSSQFSVFTTIALLADTDITFFLLSQLDS